MRQRLGIAAALLRNPRLLILDEPATGLDPAGMRDMRLLIRQLADDGITVLLSSHQLPEVEELCDRVAIIRDGRVVYEGALADLKRTAASGYRLRTTDDERAEQVCRSEPGIREMTRVHGELRFSAEEGSVARLSVSLIGAGASILALSPETASLEDLFFHLTEGAGAAPSSNGISGTDAAAVDGAEASATGSARVAT